MNNLPTEESYGIIPFRFEADELQFLVVRHHQGHWGFPKGRREAGETPEETARRELREEVALTEVTLLNDSPFKLSYPFEREGKIWQKEVGFFVGSVNGGIPKHLETELIEYRWAAEEALLELLPPEGIRLAKLATVIASETVAR